MRSNEVWSKLLVFSIIVDFRCQPYLKKDTYEERAERPSVYVERSRSVREDGARTVLVHLRELLPRPKVSLRALILRSNISAAQ